MHCVLGQLLPSVFKSNAWGILHTLLEMFSYRLHHIQPHYRIQLLSQLHQLAQVQQMNHYQLHLWYDLRHTTTTTITTTAVLRPFVQVSRYQPGFY